ncbi:hypothetical protein [uncultured Bacteroides sp.]|uniref:hypothetical protein n=1 Tax=uncultured Bacteroides sp. TaxID=162156 RepID=UPI0026126F8E|nr:hypothetical protein [uncultured Bacteroides sp.]
MRLYIVFLFCLFFIIDINSKVTYNFPDKVVSNCYEQDVQKCYSLIENQAHYLLTLVKPWNGNINYKLITQSQGVEEHITRPNTGAVAIFSFLYRFGDYDENIVGISRNELLNTVIVPMMRYLISVHKTGNLTFDNGKQWGMSWQSAHWTHQLAQGAATIWNDLPYDIRLGIKKLVSVEANRIAELDPPYSLKNDSKSEENAWNAGALSSAILLMPDNPNVVLWDKSLQRWLVSSYVCPNDSFSTAIIDGVRMKDIYEGANIYNDYTLENHGIVHPDYMTACTLKGEIMIDYLASGRVPTDACMFNVDKIYEQLKLMLLPSGGFLYPTGQDWAINRHSDWANIHAFCLYYYKDPVALYWLRVTLDVIEKMQSRHIDKRIYGENENFFPSSQTLSGLGLVDCWKMLMLASPLKELEPDNNVSRMYPNGKFYIRRLKNSVHSIAWGKRIQIQSMSWSKDPIMAPDWKNCIGNVRLQGDKKSLPVELRSIYIDTLSNSIKFKIEVLHGKSILSNLNVSSNDNGELIISEKLQALADVKTEEISTLSFGILNHPHWIEEKGYRTVKNNNKEFRFSSLSGNDELLSGTQITIDDRMSISTLKPVNGIYICAKEWFRSKVFDYLILNRIKGSYSWKKGDVISENTVKLKYAEDVN